MLFETPSFFRVIPCLHFLLFFVTLYGQLLIVVVVFAGPQRPGRYAVGIFTNAMPGTTAKLIIKCSLFLLKFKDASQAETEDWLRF